MEVCRREEEEVGQPSAPLVATGRRMGVVQVTREVSPPLPPKREPIGGPLFLGDESESEEDDLGRELDGEGMLDWDATEEGRVRAGVARDETGGGRGAEVEEEEGVGPTQKTIIRGLFD